MKLVRSHTSNITAQLNVLQYKELISPKINRLQKINKFMDAINKIKTEITIKNQWTIEMVIRENQQERQTISQIK